MNSTKSNRHFSSEDLDTLLHRGESTATWHEAELEAHAASCAPCATELENLRALLGDFRTATTAFAEAQQPLSVVASSRPAPTRGWTTRGWRFAALLLPVATACAIAIARAPLHGTHRIITPTVATSAAASNDDKFMNSIDADLSASMPEALAPLAQTTATQTASTSSARKASAF